MAAFRGERVMRAAVPVQAGFAESRPGRDDGRVARPVRRALVDRHEVRRPQGSDAVGVGLEVVDHPDVADAQLRGERDGVHHPRKIRRLAPSVADRSGDAERRMSHAQRVLADELPDDLLQTRVRAAGERLLGNDVRSLRILEERDVGLRATDVAGQDHGSSSSKASSGRSSSVPTAMSASSVG